MKMMTSVTFNDSKEDEIMKLNEIIDKLDGLTNVEVIVDVCGQVADKCTDPTNIALYKDCDVLEIGTTADGILVVTVKDTYDDN